MRLRNFVLSLMQIADIARTALPVVDLDHLWLAVQQ